MLALLVLATLGGATPEQSREHCLRSVATELEVSGETPGEVAAATMTACAKTKEPAPPGSLLATMSRADRIEFERRMDKADYDDILLGVVRLRACRKTPGCKSR